MKDTGKKPEVAIEHESNKFVKYKKGYEIGSEKIFLLMPSLKEVAREKYNKDIADYKSFAAKKLSIPVENIVLLSNDMKLNLDVKPGTEIDYSPTREFEDLFERITK